MQSAHELILLGGVLALLALFAGLVLSRRVGAPVLLVFLVLGMLAGEDGPGGIVYNDASSAYLIGSAALAVILFEGGLNTSLPTLRIAALPALLLATLGTAVTAGVLGLVAWALGMSPLLGLLVGAVVAPTDAAVVTVMLRHAGVRLPERLVAALEVESGFNDPMAVFLTMLLVETMLAPAEFSAGHAALMFAQEMVGGAVLGVAGGAALAWLLRRLKPGSALAPALCLAGAFTLFGGAQTVGASGFLALYLAGIVVGRDVTRQAAPDAEGMVAFFEALGWLAQITLFLMLGLLVTPHEIDVLPNLVLGLALIFVARPLACLPCLMPLGFGLRQSLFASWVGLRGAVPIYLAIIPLLMGAPHSEALFNAALVIVITSLVIQGWTIGPAARLLKVAE